jgi:hypothetical protein
MSLARHFEFEARVIMCEIVKKIFIATWKLWLYISKILLLLVSVMALKENILKQI